MLRLVQFKSRSPYWYVRGTVGGVEIFESTQTVDMNEAERFLHSRQTRLYREAVLSEGEEPAVSKEMIMEIVALASRARNRTQKNNGQASISAEEVAQLFIRQRGRCAISGITFHLDQEVDGSTRNRAFAPSLDRIDNSKGYESDNIRLVCRIGNYAMNIWGEKALRDLSLGVTSLWEKTCAYSVAVHTARYYDARENVTISIKKGRINE